MNLISRTSTSLPLCRALSEIVREELEHFRWCLPCASGAASRSAKLPPSRYGAELHGLIRKEEPGRAVDRFLIAGLIELGRANAFALLETGLPDPELAAFYGQPVRV